MLEEDEVDPGRVVAVKPPEDARVDQLLDLPDRAREEERMVHHDDATASLRPCDQVFRLGSGRGEGLLHEHVLAVFERLPGEGVMARDRRGNGHRVDVGRRQDLRRVLSQGDAGVLGRGPRARDRIPVGDGDDAAIRVTMEIPDEVRAPVAEADDPKSEHSGPRVSRDHVPGQQGPPRRITIGVAGVNAEESPPAAKMCSNPPVTSGSPCR